MNIKNEPTKQTIPFTIATGARMHPASVAHNQGIITMKNTNFIKRIAGNDIIFIYQRAR
jgi:hypothetical protein